MAYSYYNQGIAPAPAPTVPAGGPADPQGMYLAQSSHLKTLQEEHDKLQKELNSAKIETDDADKEELITSKQK